MALRVNLVACPEGVDGQRGCCAAVAGTFPLLHILHVLSGLQSSLYLMLTLCMMQSLQALHVGAGYAHLDVTPNNGMLQTGRTEPWDQLRLLDLGLAQPCFEGASCYDCVLAATVLSSATLSTSLRPSATTYKKCLATGSADGDKSKPIRVFPEGCTPLYASPQQLRARQCQLEYTRDDSTSDASSSYTSNPAAVLPGKPERVMQRLSHMLKKFASCGFASTPEQEEESDEALIDGRAADVFSAGVVLFELVSHCSPAHQYLIHIILHIPQQSWAAVLLAL